VYFYHEGFYDAYHTAAVLEDLWVRERSDDEPDFEPIRTPAILNWLAIVSFALCGLVAAIAWLS
jgi:hypothetical protein